MDLSDTVATVWDTGIPILLIIPLTLGWVAVMVNLGQHHDLVRTTETGWLLLLVFLPLVGSTAYVLSSTRRTVNEGGKVDVPRQGEQQEAVTRARDTRVLSALHDSGKLTDGEYAVEKARVIRAAADRCRTAAHGAVDSRDRQ